MAQTLVFTTNAAAAGRAAQQARPADGPVADGAGGDLIGAESAEDALTVHALGGETFTMRQVTAVAQVQPFTWLSTYIAHQGFELV